VEIKLEKIRYMMGLFEGGGDYQDAWECLKEWLDKFEAAQQMREPDSLNAGDSSLPAVVKSESNLPA